MNKKDQKYILRWAKKIKAADILGGVCAKCDENNIILMNFHHTNNKEHRLSHLLSNGRWSDIRKEIEKCFLMCANCHAATYVYTKRTKDLKEKLFNIFGSNCCIKCGYDGVGLNFHHINNKEFNFGDLIARKIRVAPECLVEELSKCILLCHNCHIKEHFDHEKFNKFLPAIKKKVMEHKECPPTIDRQKVLNLLCEGQSKAAIARMIGCTKSTISYITKKDGEPDRRTGTVLKTDRT